jgi:hypothetical protein
MSYCKQFLLKTITVTFPRFCKTFCIFFMRGQTLLYISTFVDTLNVHFDIVICRHIDLSTFCTYRYKNLSTFLPVDISTVDVLTCRYFHCRHFNRLPFQAQSRVHYNCIVSSLWKFTNFENRCCAIVDPVWWKFRSRRICFPPTNRSMVVHYRYI